MQNLTFDGFVKLAKKQNKNLDKLFEVIDILANGGILDARYREHDLIGNYKVRVSVTLSRAGCSFTRFRIMYWF